MRFASAIASSGVRVTMTAPFAASDVATIGTSGGLRVPTACGDAIGERPVPGDEDRPRVRVVLGLRDQIRGDPSGAAAAGDDDDLGRAGIEIDRAVAGDVAPWPPPRSGCRARRSCPRAGSSRVPYASAAIAWAPPMRNSRVTPASSAAAITAGSGRGQTAMISPTPATRAGIAVISSDEGSGKRPPGT